MVSCSDMDPDQGSQKASDISWLVILAGAKVSVSKPSTKGCIISSTAASLVGLAVAELAASSRVQNSVFGHGRWNRCDE